MAGLLNIAISGLQVSQAALTTTGHNITNANTEGYSRQRVIAETNIPQRWGPGYLGTGAHVQTIERVVNQFMIQQVRQDTSLQGQMENYAGKISQIDNFLGDENTGLSSAFSNYFAALQSAGNSPADIPGRQVVLSRATELSQRFNAMYSKMDDLNSSINNELSADVSQINTLSKNIADVNDAILQAKSGGKNGALPVNDLLDQRDALLAQLANMVGITSVVQDDGAVNVFVGKGQALVVGIHNVNLSVSEGDNGASRKEVTVTDVNGEVREITNDLSGGQVGGMISFRNETLDPTQARIGRLALVFADSMNRQQRSGLDLKGNYGGLLFSDINERQMTLDRAVSSVKNTAPPDRVITVNIDDTSALTGSEYELKLTGTGGSSYSVVRLSDNVEVASGVVGAAGKNAISVDGMSINLESGSFHDGDSFRLLPTRFAARDFSVVATRAESLAFAAPVNTSASTGNIGTGTVSQARMLNILDSKGVRTDAFANAGSLKPPLVVRFITPTSYEILDNSDPAFPKPMNPPLTNLTFVPGQANQILGTEPGQTVVGSNGFNAGRVPNTVVTIPPGTQPLNAFQAENLTLAYTDPATGAVSNRSLAVAAGTSARDIAASLSAMPGVTASASTYMALKINDDGAGQPLQITLNGIDLTAGVQGTSGIVPPPVPLTADYLADVVNNSTLSSNGIRAVSDGTTLRLYSSKGDDFALQVAGDATDSVQVKDAAPALLSSTVNLNNGVNFNAGGPTSFTIDIGTGPRTIQLAGVFTDQQSALAYIQQQVNTAFNSASKVAVTANSDGTLSFATADNSYKAQIAIGNVTNDVLGLASAAAEGVVGPAGIVTVAGAGALPTRNALTVGGSLSLTLSDGYSISSSANGLGNIFTSNPPAASTYFGYTFTINGNPAAGDIFTADFNSSGVSDNRNLNSMVALQAKSLVNGKQSFSVEYSQLTSQVGTDTNKAQANFEASKSVLKQSQDLRNGVSGVNLDEEAANLVKYEMAYNASSKVITVARDVFDTLLRAFG